jgi:hypothetical protein
LNSRKKKFGKDYTYFAFRIKEDENKEVIRQIKNLVTHAKRAESQPKPEVRAKLPHIIEE